MQPFKDADDLCVSATGGHSICVAVSVGLSPRQKEVMTLVATGLMNKQTAAMIGLHEVTVKVPRHNIMRKLGAKSFPDLVRMANILGLPHKI